MTLESLTLLIMTTCGEGAWCSPVYFDIYLPLIDLLRCVTVHQRQQLFFVSAYSCVPIASQSHLSYLEQDLEDVCCRTEVDFHRREGQTVLYHALYQLLCLEHQVQEPPCLTINSRLESQYAFLMDRNYILVGTCLNMP